MKKISKRFFAVLIVVVMVMSFSVVAYADATELAHGQTDVNGGYPVSAGSFILSSAKYVTFQYKSYTSGTLVLTYIDPLTGIPQTREYTIIGDGVGHTVTIGSSKIPAVQVNYTITVNNGSSAYAWYLWATDTPHNYTW